MKKTLTALAAVAVLAAGCGGGDGEPKPDTETTKATVKAIPSPSPNEAQALMDELERIVPGAPIDRAKAIDAARGTCESILGGAQNVEQATVTRFTAGLDVDEVTPEQAAQIVAVVKSEPWCA